MNAPRILDLSGTPFPKALIQSVDRVNGSATFAWLNAGGNQVDSGGSVVRFTPVTETVDGIEVPADPGDEALIDAIENPPAPPAPVVILTPLTIRGRLTNTELLALDLSEDPEVTIVRNNLIAASEVRSDDPRTDVGKAILISKGIITSERASVIFA